MEPKKVTTAAAAATTATTTTTTIHNGTKQNQVVLYYGVMMMMILISVWSKKNQWSVLTDFFFATVEISIVLMLFFFVPQPFTIWLSIKGQSKKNWIKNFKVFFFFYLDSNFFFFWKKWIQMWIWMCDEWTGWLAVFTESIHRWILSGRKRLNWFYRWKKKK